MAVKVPTAAYFYKCANNNIKPTTKDRGDIRKLVPLLHLMQGYYVLLDELEAKLREEGRMQGNVADWFRNLSRKTEKMSKTTFDVFTPAKNKTLSDNWIAARFSERSYDLMQELLETITDRSLETILGLCGSVLAVCEEGIKGMSWYISPLIASETANVFRHLCDYLPKSDRDFRDLVKMQLNDFMKRANTIEVVD